MKMKMTVKIRKYSGREAICGAFFVFCFIPFLFPNPIVKTNIQPYACIIGVLILLLYFGNAWHESYARNTFIMLGLFFYASLFVMVISDVSINAFRGVYNYFALFVITCATISALESSKKFPEKLCKVMILIWFLVASIQFFFNRGFATGLISGVRWSYSYRGVVGLASEPSFLGIVCFYFLHLIRKFKNNRFVYTVIVLLMGVVYAQSTTGIIFIVGFFSVFLLDVINSRRGVYIWIASIVAIIAFLFYLKTKLSGSRLSQIVNAFMNGGIDSVLEDASALVRFNAIGRAFQTALSNGLMPKGFGNRIGSAYGGMLVELGLFALPAIILISWSMSLTFEKKRSRIAYFIVVTLLLLNNTQIGNPLLLMTMGVNLFFNSEKRKGIQQLEQDRKNYKRT